MNDFILLGIVLEIIAFAYIILVCFLVYSDKVSVKTINKSIIGYRAIIITGLLSIIIGIIIKLI